MVSIIIICLLFMVISMTGLHRPHWHTCDTDNTIINRCLDFYVNVIFIIDLETK